MSSREAPLRALQEKPIVSKSEFKWDFGATLVVGLFGVGLVGCLGLYLPVLIK